MRIITSIHLDDQSIENGDKISEDTLEETSQIQDILNEDLTLRIDQAAQKRPRGRPRRKPKVQSESKQDNYHFFNQAKKLTLFIN